MDSRPLNDVAEAAVEAMQSPAKLSVGRRLEYWAAKSLLSAVGYLPRRAARAVCAALAVLSYYLWPRLREIGLWNLGLAYPEWTPRRRRRVLFASFLNLGRMLADFAHFPRWNRANIESLIVYDGYDHFLRASHRGTGVIFLTAHFGGWELGSFAHGVYGHPVNFVVRRLDNPLVDALVGRYRCLSGGRPIEKGDFARQALRALRRGESVGILMDQNMLAPEGVFVDFFGIKACTTPGPARVAKKTGAPLVLGLVIWDEVLRKYRLRFEPLDWITRDDLDEEILVNTAQFTERLERYIRQYPEQWLWVHRRWKTRPPGEPPLYL